MPKGTKIHSCVQKVMAQGKKKPNAIRICQESTGQSYKTGKPSEAKAKRALRRRANGKK